MSNMVAAVVVTYNRLDKLKKCVNSLMMQTVKLNHIIVIDNCSTDGTADYLDSQKNVIEVVRTSENLGGAMGFELGIKWFMENTRDEFVWVMDDDTIPTETALEKLVKNSDRKFGFLASNVRWIDDTPAIMNLPTVADDWNAALMANDAESGLIKVERASFVSLLFRRDIILKVGLPLGKMFIWGDDTEYTQRITKKYPGYFVSNSVVIHEMGQNVGIDIFGDTSDRLWRYFYLYRNRFYNAKAKSKKAEIKCLIKSGIVLCKLIVKPNVEHRFKKIGYVVRGTGAGIFFKPSISFFKGE